MPRARWTLRPGHSQVPQKNMLKQGVTEKCVRVYGAGGGGRRRHINLLVTSVRRLCTFGKVEKKEEKGGRGKVQLSASPGSSQQRYQRWGGTVCKASSAVRWTFTFWKKECSSVSVLSEYTSTQAHFYHKSPKQGLFFYWGEKKQESLFFSLSVDVNAFVYCCCDFFHQFSIHDFLHFFCPRHHLESPITVTVTGVSRLPSNWCLEVGNYMFL